MSVPFMDLAWQLQATGGKAEAAVLETLKRGDFILGQAVSDFEAAFAGYCDSAHAVGTDSGLSALALSLQALGVGPGDEVITCPTTFIATVFAITSVGATPVFVDCLPGSGLMDPSKIEAALTEKTKALMPVHLYGKICNMDAIGRIANTHHLVVIEDACQAHGAKRNGKKAGSFGDAGCFSFYPAKNLGCAGDGGMLVTSKEKMASDIKRIRNYGQEPKNMHPVLGTNARLDTLQAAFLQTKLPLLDDFNQKRKEAAHWYHEVLEPLGLIHPAVEEGHVYHVYAIEVENRDEIRDKLDTTGIQTGIHYPVPCHLQEALKPFGFRAGQFPESEKRAARLLSLPMFPGITKAQVEEVGRALKAAGARS